MGRYYSPDGNYEVWDEKPEGYYTKEEWDALHPIPPYVPTKEEKIAALDYQYTTDKEQLMKDYSDAILHDDAETAAIIKEDMAALDEKYDEDYRKIEEEDEGNGN